MPKISQSTLYLLSVAGVGILSVGVVFWSIIVTQIELTRAIAGELGPVYRIQEAGEEASTAGWQTYRNEEFGFEVKYPQTLSLGTKKPGLGTSSSIAWLKFPPRSYPGTNFEEADLGFHNIGERADCLEIIDANHQLDRKEVVNGIVFRIGSVEYLSAGNRYSLTVYRTVHDGTCFEIAAGIHKIIVNEYFPDLTEFDDKIVSQVFKEVLDTFRFTN